MYFSFLYVFCMVEIFFSIPAACLLEFCCHIIQLFVSGLIRLILYQIIGFIFFFRFC